MDEKTLYQIGAKLTADGVNVEDNDAVRECLSNCAVPTMYYRLSKSDLRRAVYSGLPVTLDGKLAKIIGFSNDFATVKTISSSPWFASFEWSWTTVARIVSHGGHFKS